MTNKLIDGLYFLYLESGKRDTAIDRMYSRYSKAKGTQIKNLKGTRQTELEEYGISLDGGFGIPK